MTPPPSATNPSPRVNPYIANCDTTSPTVAKDFDPSPAGTCTGSTSNPAADNCLTTSARYSGPTFSSVRTATFLDVHTS